MLLLCGLTTPAAAGNATVKGPKAWKAVFMTGDNSIPAFDNARTAVTDIWKGDGIAGVAQLSMNPEFVSKAVTASSAKGLDQALRKLAVKDGEGCMVWLTSHGNEDGLYMRDQDVLSPEDLGTILDRRCGKRPTVLIVSACHSGVFLSLAAPNRIILTAARNDRKSFGCSIKYEYTFFDECLLRYYGKSKTFAGLAVRANLCIKKREKEEDASPPSLPQVATGKDMREVEIPHKLKPAGKSRSKSVATNKKSRSR
jgi:hypothetical protein